MASRSEALRGRAILALVTAVLAVGIARDARGLDEVTVQLKWIHQAQFAGFYTAEVQGLYEEEGLSVTFLPGGVGIDIVDGVAHEAVHFGVVGADSILVERAQGVPIVALATTYRINPFVLVAFADSGIMSPYDFVGRTVALATGYETAQYSAMLHNLGIDPATIETVDYTYDDGPFLRGEIDVTVSFAAGSLLPLREATAGRALNLIWPDDYGVHFYSDTIVTSDVLLVRNPDLVLRFLRATLAGHRYAIEHPVDAIDATMRYAAIQDREMQQEMLEASIPLIHTGRGHLGWMDDDVWQGMYDVLQENGLLMGGADVEEAYTMTFLDAIYGAD
jgi:NitT/TauT family transport system substrate-binding protein